MGKVTIIGCGYVGLTTAACMNLIGHNVICIDSDNVKVDKLKKNLLNIYEPGLKELLFENKKIDFTSNLIDGLKTAEYIFICVGTPEKINGSTDLSYIYNAIDEIILNLNSNCTIIIKSTVPVGTCDKLEKYIIQKKLQFRIDIVSNPEFLSQGNAINDFLFAKRIIIGCDNENAKNILQNLYKPLLNAPYNIPILFTDRRSSEMIKYASNNFLALKLSYINEISNLCETVDADIDDVILGMSYDTRIGKEFLKVGIGYGGSCLPKDTKSLKFLSKKNGCEIKTISSCINVNETQLLKVVDKIKKDYGSLKNKKIAILGVTFKSGTDDIRQSPAIKNVKVLIELGANVNIYDPLGIDNLKKEFEKMNIKNQNHGDIKYFKNIDFAIKKCDIAIILTDCPEIKKYDISNYKKYMKKPIVYDGRNCYKLNSAYENGIVYISMGRKRIFPIE